jgi:hydrogenase maturation factor
MPSRTRTSCGIRRAAVSNTALCEIAVASRVVIRIAEPEIPLRPDVHGAV